MKCPKCGGDLQQVAQDSIQVDRCAQCGGLWFDMLEAERLVNQRGSAAVDTGSPATGAEQNQTGQIECPLCHTQMIRMVDIKQHHIWYESCPVCYGKWFDAGEFRDLQDESIMDFFRGLFTEERR